MQQETFITVSALIATRKEQIMPYKHGNITYGLPQDAYPQAEINQYANDLTEMVGLNWELVGITFMFDKEGYDLCPVEEIKAQTPYCVMVKQAAKGRECKCRLEHHKCDGATTALGLERSTGKIESGQEYFSYNLYASNAIARRMRSNIKSLHDTEELTYGILIQLLKQCTNRPDVIIGIINPYQAMRLVQGYEYHTGVKPNIDMGAMQAMCSEVTTSPYLTGEMNVSVMCPSTRMLCGWSENDMAVGIPFELFEKIVEGVIATKPSY